MQKIIDTTICIIDESGPLIHNFYENECEALKECERLNDIQVLSGEKSTHITSIYKTFEDMLREKYLTGEINIIDKAKWWEMLEILPPLRWKNDAVIETFCMSEFMVSSFTQQYGRYGDKYISKMIDFNDPKTEIKVEDFSE